MVFSVSIRGTMMKHHHQEWIYLARPLQLALEVIVLVVLLPQLTLNVAQTLHHRVHSNLLPHTHTHTHTQQGLNHNLNSHANVN